MRPLKLSQDLADLLFSDPLLLHLVRLAIGRTLINPGGVSQGLVTNREVFGPTLR
jgi:hypothetical protein